jgi:hypothetical protein
MVKNKDIIIFSILFILGISFAYIYNDIKTTKKDIFARIENEQIEQISTVLNNIERDFIASLGIKNEYDLLESFRKKEIREKYEHITSLILSPKIKYAYILQKDESDRFRY